MAGNREPVVTYVDLLTLDVDEAREGWIAGVRGEPCGDERSRSYWHGWRNGRFAAGHAAPDQYHRQLSRDVDRLNRMAGHA